VRCVVVVIREWFGQPVEYVTVGSDFGTGCEFVASVCRSVNISIALVAAVEV